MTSGNICAFYSSKQPPPLLPPKKIEEKWNLDSWLGCWWKMATFIGSTCFIWWQYWLLGNASTYKSCLIVSEVTKQNRMVVMRFELFNPTCYLWVLNMLTSSQYCCNSTWFSANRPNCNYKTDFLIFISLLFPYYPYKTYFHSNLHFIFSVLPGSILKLLSIL